MFPSALYGNLTLGPTIWKLLHTASLSACVSVSPSLCQGQSVCLSTVYCLSVSVCTPSNKENVNIPAVVCALRSVSPTIPLYQRSRVRPLC